MTTNGITYRELAFVGSVVGIVIVGAMFVGSLKTQVDSNTKDAKEAKGDLKAIVQHDADTTARLRDHEDTFNEVKANISSLHTELIASRSEFPTQFQFNEFKERIDPELKRLQSNKMNHAEFDAWKNERDKTIDLLQRQIEDINRQIAAAILKTDLTPLSRPLLPSK